MNREGFSLRELQARLGISRSLVNSMMAAGLVTPRRGPRNAYVFTFQDVVLIRTAHSLRTARVPVVRLLQSLRRLRDAEAGRHLSCVHIAAVGQKLAVREGDDYWLIDSGQYVMPFEPATGSAAVIDMARNRQEGSTELDHPKGSEECVDGPEQVQSARLAAGTPDLIQTFNVACDAEQDAPDKAEYTYRRILATDPAFRDAWLNLGCLLSHQDRLDEAIEIYETALHHLPDDATLHFNLGVTLEDRGQPREALARYRRSIELAPDDADAHFNAARLHQELGDLQRAIRHFNDYRRLGETER